MEAKKDQKGNKIIEECEIDDDSDYSGDEWSEEEWSDSEEEEIAIDEMNEEELEKELEKEKGRVEELGEALLLEKKSAEEARNSIEKIVKQIADYKVALEEDLGELESQLAEKEEEVGEEKEKTKALQSKTEKLMEEKEALVSRMSELENANEEALEEGAALKEELNRETIDNLRTLMDELTRIEEANVLLEETYQATKDQIKEENQAHQSSLQQLIKETERVEEAKKKMKTLQETNSNLIAQIKQCRKASKTPRLKSTTGASSGAESANEGLSDELFTASPPVTSEPSPPPSSSGMYKLENKLQPHHPGGLQTSIVCGGQLWCGCSDGTVRIWEMDTKQVLEDRKYHTAPIFGMTLVKDRVWTTSGDKFILVWSNKKTQPLKKFKAGGSSKDKDIHGNVLLEIDQFVWCGCSDGALRLWDPKSYKLKKELKLDADSVLCLLKRTNQVWAGNKRGNLNIWSTTHLKPIKTLTGHTGAINAINNVGSFEIWSSSSDQTIRCWNAETHDAVQILPAAGPVLCLLQVRSLHHVLCGVGTGQLLVWSQKTYELIEEVPTEHEGALSMLTLDKRNMIWSGGQDHSLHIFSPRSTARFT